MADQVHASEAQYCEMIRLKTGALIGASSASGAIVGSALKDKNMINAAYGFGESLGIVYQVQDDLLDLLGDESVIGKPIFTDIRRGKKSLVLIHLLSQCSGEESKFMRTLFGRLGSYDDWEVEKARSLLTHYNSAKYAQKFALRHMEHAEKASAFCASVERLATGFLSSSYLAMRKY